jgi:putative ABC transport system permease protein
MLGQVVFELRTVGNPTDVIAAVRHEARKVEKDLDLVDIKTQAMAVDESLNRDRSLAGLASFFSVLALLLASIGLYGTMSYSTNRKTSEIGIRMALGAERKHVLNMVLREGIALTLIGIAIGLTAGWTLTRVIASQLYRVDSADPASFFGASVFLSAVTLLASYIPARRAAKVDPMVALRYE